MSKKVLPWQVLRSRISLADQWITVRSDDCLTEGGLEISPFHVLEYPAWVNVVPFTKEGKLLLVKEYRHGRGEVLTGLVSGGVEPEDHEPEGTRSLNAARRELREETGYDSHHFYQVLSCYPNPANQSNTVTTWVALDAFECQEQSLDPNESIELIESDMAYELEQIELGRKRMQAMHIAALYAAERWLKRNKLS